MPGYQTLIRRFCACRGQATVEYVLMLATVVVVLSAFLTAFHTNIVRFLFTFIGQLLTS